MLPVSRPTQCTPPPFCPPPLQVMLGVDRLDMIKGIPQKLLAFEKFLQEHEEWRDKVLLVQVRPFGEGGGVDQRWGEERGEGGVAFEKFL